MSTYNTLLTCVLIIFVFLLLSMLSLKNILDNYLKRVNKNYIITPLIVISVILIVVSFLTPYFYTDTAIGNSISFTQKTGYTGDTLGGIMNPFIALAGAVLTFIAFYIQKIANDDIKNQFKIQQFESQFYERIKLIKEEINNCNLLLKDDKTLFGRQVFYELDKEIKLIYFLVNNLLNTNDVKIKFEISYYIFYKGRIKYFNRINHFKDKYNLKREELLEIELFLSSIYEYLKTNNEESIDLNLEIILDNIFDVVKNGGRLDEFLDVNTNYHFAYLLLKMNDNLNLNHLPFKGMETKLSLLLRQLFSLVKFVSVSKLFDYDKKRNYLRILRSILSNYEQLHIFYNWFSNTGKSWENEENKFLTDYRMIHNLPSDFVIEDINLETIFLNIKFQSENDRVKDSLFEFQDY